MSHGSRRVMQRTRLTCRCRHPDKARDDATSKGRGQRPASVPIQNRRISKAFVLRNGSVSKHEQPRPFTPFDRLRTGFETAFDGLLRANGLWCEFRVHHTSATPAHGEGHHPLRVTKPVRSGVRFITTAGNAAAVTCVVRPLRRRWDEQRASGCEARCPRTSQAFAL